MKSKEKVCFLVASRIFLHNRNHFLAAHSHSRLHSFPFLLLLPVSRPHEFSALMWCFVLRVPGECTFSSPQPILLAIFESWHYMFATRHNWLLHSLAPLLVLAPTVLPFMVPKWLPNLPLVSTWMLSNFILSAFLLWFHTEELLF